MTHMTTPGRCNGRAPAQHDERTVEMSTTKYPSRQDAKTLIAAAACGLTMTTGGLIAADDALGWSTTEKVVICHATGSTSNPYVELTISEAAAFHGHTGRSHQNGADIIPPYDEKGTLYSQNWNDRGRAIWANHCRIPKSPEPKVVYVDRPGPERVVYRDVPGPERVVTVVQRVEVPGPERVVVKTRWRTRVKVRRVTRWRTRYVCRRPDNPSPRFTG